MAPATGKVWFIGAGPGDPELITVKGRRLIKSADLIVFAGSLVPRELLACARPDVPVIDSAPLSLPETHALLRDCARSGGLAARVHTGESSLFGAVREQAELLDAEAIPWEVVPGVSSAFAAAAAAGVSFTDPGGPQTLIFTRLSGRTPVPQAEALPGLAAHGAAMAVLLSAGQAERLQAELLAGGYAPDTCVVLGHKVGWPGGQTVRARLDDLARTAREHDFTRQTVFLVLPGESLDARASQSRLYAPGFSHGWREGAEPEERVMRQFSVSTTRREEFLDITPQVAQALRESGLAEGALLVYSPHTTAGVTINEGADPDVRRDMLAHLRALVPQSAGFRHAEGNSDAHIKTSLMGPSQLVPVSGGQLALGTWQKLYLCEFDGPRRRTVLVQALPAAPERP